MGLMNINWESVFYPECMQSERINDASRGQSTGLGLYEITNFATTKPLNPVYTI